MSNATAATVPARGEAVTVTVTEPFTYAEVQVSGVVVSYNWAFETLKSYVVASPEHGDVIVYLA